MDRVIILIIVAFLAGCSSNQSNDFTSLKQKALEIPPDFELTPPGDGETVNDETSEINTNESSDIESMILDSSDSSDLEQNNDAVNETGSLEEFIEEQF
mgnify:FL=1